MSETSDMIKNKKKEAKIMEILKTVDLKKYYGLGENQVKALRRSVLPESTETVPVEFLCKILRRF